MLNNTCQFHSETEFDKIQLSPVLHKLIIDGYIRKYCNIIVHHYILYQIVCQLSVKI